MTLVVIPEYLLELLEVPERHGEIALTQDSPRRVGLRLFFESLAGLDLPAELLDLAAEMQQRFDLVPGHWLRLGLEEGRIRRYALNYEVPPQNHYPISTLRVFLRRYGCRPPAHLERALAPALELPDSRWGVTLELTAEGPRPRLFGRIPRALLEEVGLELAGPLLLPLLERLQAFPGSPWCYLSFAPNHPELLSVDLEDLPLESLDLPLAQWPARPEALLCPYVKFRGQQTTAYLAWPTFAAWWRPAVSSEDFLERVRSYYDQRQPDYLQHLGTTWQAGHWGREGAQASNRELARRARVEPGTRVLDAGCGVAGPALDIAAWLEGVEIDALTLCPDQVEQAKHHIREAGQQHKVRVHQGDFHQLPFADGCFQRVLYLESSGYAYDRAQLFREAYRVLGDQGLVYVKDVFRRAGPLRSAEWVELSRFDRLYAQKTPTLEETVECLQHVGFRLLHALELGEQIAMDHYQQAMGTAQQPTSFGLAHGQSFRNLPLFFGEVLAQRI